MINTTHSFKEGHAHELVENLILASLLFKFLLRSY